MDPTVAVMKNVQPKNTQNPDVTYCKISNIWFSLCSREIIWEVRVESQLYLERF